MAPSSASVASNSLRLWLEKISDPTWDPWPFEVKDTTPLDKQAVSADPTADFEDVSDEFDLCEDEDEVDNGDNEDNVVDNEDDPMVLDFKYKGKKDLNGRFHDYGNLFGR
jgi:hypothetical protein